MGKIQILLIEDNRLLRDGIANMINEHGEFEVVARSEDGDAVTQLKGLAPPPVSSFSISAWRKCTALT